MRVFIGSSKEQQGLVEWLTDFMRRNFAGALEPEPWTKPQLWPGGRFTLESLLRIVDDTDAAILFWTADDKTWYRETGRHEPRDNLVFEAGLFIAAHGRERTQLMVPSYARDDQRGRVSVPSDVAGLTYNSFDWRDGSPEATGLPYRGRIVCDGLRALGPRSRLPVDLIDLGRHGGVEQIRTFVGEWFVMHTEGIARLAAYDNTKAIDILAAYRVGELHRRLDSFRSRQDVQLRACFADMWDRDLCETYRRKYHDREPDYLRAAVVDSITRLVGECEVTEVGDQQPIRVSNAKNPPRARYEIRLTRQRITYSLYRVDQALFLVPLDMKRAQNPAPLAWLVSQETAPRTFEHYLQEFDRMFDEAVHVYP